jgi:Sec-independent protein translocase protein TatA
MDFMSVSGSEILMILLVALLVVGPTRVIQLARTLGKIMHTVRKASFDLTSAVSRELETEEKEKQPPATAEDKALPDSSGLSDKQGPPPEQADNQ